MVLASLIVAGCARPIPVAPPPPAARPPVAAAAPAGAPPPVLPDAATLKQELAIVSSPQVSRERSQLVPGHLQDLEGSWVRFGPMRVGGVQPVLQKTGRADVPLKAQLVVTHTQDYSGLCKTRTQAAHAPLPYTEERSTTYLYDYPASGTWEYLDEKDGPLLDKGRH